MAVLVWTLIAGGSLAWNIGHSRHQSVLLATHEARANFNKDLAFRQWATKHGGVYVRPDERTPPNPYLSHLPDRDLVTADGVRLTLMNPAYMMRQMTEEYEKLYGIKGRITGLVQLNPANAPDSWERKALAGFETGGEEVVEITDIGGEPHLRLMKPMIMGQGCVKCHGHLGFEVGDIRGGISVSVPFAPYVQAASQMVDTFIFSHIGIWILGLIAIAFASQRSHAHLEERKRSENALRASEERYALAARGANDGLWDWDLRSDLVYFSPRWKDMLGCPDREEYLTPDHWFERVHADDLGHLREAFEAHLSGNTSAFHCEYRVCREDGTERWMLSRGLVIRDDENRPIRISGSQTDITDQKIAEQRLEHDAVHDALTGLPNRVLFMDRLSQAIVHSRNGEGALFAVLFLDLDRFKTINDSLGHGIGDKVLIAVAEKLLSCVGLEDTVARVGGDEFVILLYDISGLSGAVESAERICEVLDRPFQIEGREIFANGSIGIAMSYGDYHRAEDLLRDADTAMYRAKESRELRIEVFDPEMHDNAVNLLHMETELKNALKRNEFQVHYQPIFNLRTGRIQGLEALVRWQHPHRGLVPPGEFIPVAEEMGLIPHVSDWVLDQACRQIKEWNERFGTTHPYYVSVNLSGREFLQTSLVARIDRALSAANLDPHYLNLEVTESVLMKNPEKMGNTLSEFKRRGLGLSIDDFGTGYCSLSYLQHFPFDTLKIDKAFVRDMTPEGKGRQLVRTIIHLARDFGLNVIAEGVETPEQEDRLRALGCELVQGYLYFRPMVPEQVCDLLEGDGNREGEADRDASREA